MVLISLSEDGDYSMEVKTRAEVEAMLDNLEEDYGRCLSWEDIQKNGGLEYSVGLIIIDGDIVVPKPVEVVTKYTLNLSDNSGLTRGSQT